MHASDGVQRAPKWKHVPAPPDRHVKYAAVAGKYAQVGAGHGTSRAATSGGAAGPLTGVTGVAGGAALPVATGGPDGCGRSGGGVQATSATRTSHRTARL